jgi:membrane protein YqaA with SNARE-associated domain
VLSYLGLFLSAFLAATLLPVWSEAVLAAMSAARGHDLFLLFVVATAGNTLGAVVNWALGKYLLHWQHKRWFPFTPAQIERGSNWFRRYGVWSLLLAWMPVIGDPLTFFAGVMKVRLWRFLILVTIGKAARYALVIAAAMGLVGD